MTTRFFPLILAISSLATVANAQSIQGVCGTTTTGGTASCGSIPVGSQVTNVAWSGNNLGSCVSDFRVSHNGASAFLGDNGCGLNQTSVSTFNGMDASGTWTIDSVRNCKISCNSTASVQFFVYYLPPASLGVSPTSLSFSTPINTTPGAQSIVVKNSGGLPMSWTLTSTDAAIIVNPTSGTGLAAGASTTVSVAVPGSSTAMSKSATLTVSAGTAGARQVAVTYSTFVPCVGSQTDPNNCGTCGHVCPASNACVNGVCTCTGSLTDPNNCGACGHVCPGASNATATCSNGVCGLVCNPGYTSCGGQCVDTQTDSANCGSCGYDCSTEGAAFSCHGGICGCGPGLVGCCGGDICRSSCPRFCP